MHLSEILCQIHLHITCVQLLEPNSIDALILIDSYGVRSSTSQASMAKWPPAARAPIHLSYSGSKQIEVTCKNKTRGKCKPFVFHGYKYNFD